jgi:hypothetical protein
MMGRGSRRKPVRISRHRSARRSRAFQAVVILLGCTSLSCDALDEPTPSSFDEDFALELREQVFELYEKAKDSGETVPENVSEWVQEDIERMWTWEYKVLQMEEVEPSALEEELNALGKERWECSMAVSPASQLTVLCKRQAKSYLKLIPFKDVLKLVPVGEGGGE